MANELTQRLDAAWSALRASADRLVSDGLEKPTPAGWTAKEMLGHIAFWDECVEPVVIGLLRGDVERMGGWKFGSGFVADNDGEWPPEDVHNAREAAWAREQTVETVLARVDAAHAGAISAIAGFTAEELADEKFIDYVDNCASHYAGHAAELASLD
ncbi:MAG TPA: DinB family protein [Acidimicrobiales bacterium]|nr:DinB family protein [Acidimicrobiales bacterium]